mmetsp:Transcript_27810/g.46261  ORF Transcript_27810/g.46261 Transcript_27810/m.46261 type:complete len:233 (-) Transcript_27810:332-1030(-)|eukprot:CAMPEP_0119309522 /NCGR_PEP_ID=MMETSP1333-20130426/15815_1 /TAXON_ID=418940 /ORGANISM="Scyphosphaera apsteinii, Strain RCC1455" /LENGTH=232 /DNA_ID=CAMNT_0007313515 /DNA_START=125 /DNA_END=823 /DNA_ORIENTATION=-
MAEKFGPPDHSGHLEAVSGLGTKHLRVLVVDDNLMEQKIFQTMFHAANETAQSAIQKIQFFVTVATSAEEALSILAANQVSYFELVLIDMEMPLMSGDKLLPLVRRAVDERTAIIMMSASSKEDIVERCIHGAADAYLPKPIPFNMIPNLRQFCLQRDPALLDLRTTRHSTSSEGLFPTACQMSCLELSRSLDTTEDTTLTPPSPVQRSLHICRKKVGTAVEWGAGSRVKKQ